MAVASGTVQDDVDATSKRIKKRSNHDIWQLNDTWSDQVNDKMISFLPAMYQPLIDYPGISGVHRTQADGHKNLVMKLEALTTPVAV